MPLIFFLFIAVPVAEIWILIEVGGIIGAFNTILLVILTAVIGTTMLRAQGLSILQRARNQMAANTLPAVELLEGVFLLVGGALLLTPGFVTDAIGFMCLLPPTRGVLVRMVIARFSVHGYNQQPPAGGDQPNTGDFRTPNSRTIEGEYRRED